MNKIFKVIFIKSLGRMVIVSEHAKGHGKTKSTQNKKNQSIASKVKVVKPLIVISSLFLSPYVFAGNIVQSLACSNNTMPGIQVTYRVGGSNASAQFAGGSFLSSSIADFADNAVSIGSDCSNLNWALSNAVAIGGAAASIYGVAIGTGALAYDEYNVAMGSQAKARGKNSVALGANSVADRDNSFAVGSATNLRQITSVAAGTQSTDAVNKKQMDDSIKIVDDKVTVLDGLNALAVQYDSTTQDTISLKGVNGTKITNLQTGDISSASSTDAVTGGQLFTTNQNVSNLDTRVTTEVRTLNTRIGTEVTGLDAKIQSNSTAILGLDGRVTVNETDIANLQSGQSSLNLLAVQYDSASQDVVTLKGVNGTKLTNLQAGDIGSTSSTDAVTGGQLFTTNQSISNLDDRVTSEVGTLNTRIESEVTILDGRITSEVNTLDEKILSNVHAITAMDGRVGINESDIALLQQNHGTLNQLAVQYDTANQDTVTLKGENGTILTNIKAGDISSASSTDVVTGGQLFNTNLALSGLSNQVDSNANQFATALGGGASFNNGNLTLPSYSIQGVSFNNIGATFNAVNNELTALKGSVTDLTGYVNQQNQSVLDQAKNYTDVASQTLNDASQQYVDQSIAKVEQNAQQYTDKKVGDLHAQIKEEGKYFNSTGASSSGATGAGAANIVGDHSLALGSGANVQGNSSVAIGHNAQVLGDSSISMGNSNIVTGHGSGAIGDPNIVNGNGSYVLGNDNTVNADNTFVLGNNVKTTAKNSVALGNNTELTRDDTVSVGATGAERQITHVANATEATDAVNLRQMQVANTETMKSAKSYTDTRISNLESTFNDFSLSTEYRFKEIDKRFDRQGAMSAAMMNMATSTSGLAGRNRIGVGAGFQGDEKAVAVGYQRMVNQNTSLSIGGAFSDHESSGGAGVGFSW